MKKTISIIALLVILFLLIEFLVTRFTSSHSITYTIKSNDIEFNLDEKYSKKEDDTYSISISYDKYVFNYLVSNNYNKQKKIVDNIEYFKDGDNICVYPILKDKQEVYILCSDGNNIYSSYVYPNQNFINEIKNKLIEKKYLSVKEPKVEETTTYDNSTIYLNNMNNSDKILYWKYKGIDVFSKNKQTNVSVLEFDKYDNKVGYLAGNYYLIPNYRNQKVLEFSSVTAINLKNLDRKEKEIQVYISQFQRLQITAEEKKVFFV